MILSTPDQFTPNQALQKYFGYEQFRKGQDDVIEKVLNGNDVFVVMPTGAGKSLCYQLPALMKPGYTIVVSPLISLMKDQVDTLVSKEIPAACLNSTMSNRQRQQVMFDLKAGSIKLLYIAPERFTSSNFIETIKSFPPEMFIIDEAHCISQWGHDFRPQYARLGEFIQHLNLSQVCAFTATATPVVQKDIQEVLKRENMLTFVSGFKRPNLNFQVKECKSKADRLRELECLLRKKMPTIIYASTRKMVEEVGDTLQCHKYHAGMPDEERHAVQDYFMAAEDPVIVATNAFGMGIDRKDVRRVIHVNMPGSIEAYYQEAGRAGRDNQEADCILLHSYADRYIYEFFIDMSHPPKEVVFGVWRYLCAQSKRKESLELEATQEEIAEAVSACKGATQVATALTLLEKAEVLQRGLSGEHFGELKILRPAEQLMQLFQIKTQRGLFLNRICTRFGDLLTDGVKLSYYDMIQIVGLDEGKVKRVLRDLNGTHVAWTPPFAGRGVTLLQPDVKQPSIDFSELQKHEKIERNRLDDMVKYPGTHKCRQSFMMNYFGEDQNNWSCSCCDNCKGTSIKTSNRDNYAPSSLYSVLMRLRDKIAEDRGVQSYMVFSNKTIHVFAEKKPTNQGEALRISGVGPRNKWYLTPFLTVIKGWLQNERAATGQKNVPEEKLKPQALEHSADGLFRELSEIRIQQAKSWKRKPQQILSDKMLHELSMKRPKTFDEARMIRGVTLGKQEMLEPYIDKIIDYGDME
ncbi:MAG: RecQ family ATP-dependent DNA helicase [Lentisphaeria bacterium]|nr:RecQ family ATP-dependent DNA helicase [Lentisphaeria bacterium]